MKIKEITMALITITMLAACGSGEDAQGLHDKLIAAGKLQITKTTGFSISSYIPTTGVSVAAYEEQPADPMNNYVDEDDAPVDTYQPEVAVAEKSSGSSMTAVSSPIYYVTFSEESFVVEKDGKNVLSGEWDAISGETILVVINNHEHELDVGLDGDKISLRAQEEENHAIASSSNSVQPKKKKCKNESSFGYGYNWQTGQYDYHYGPQKKCWYE